MNFVTGNLMLFDFSTQHERGFRGLPSAQRKIIERWNEQVREGDTVYVLGGLLGDATSVKDLAKMLNKLNGKIVWLMYDEEGAGEDFFSQLHHTIPEEKLILRNKPLLISHFGQNFMLVAEEEKPQKEAAGYWNAEDGWTLTGLRNEQAGSLYFNERQMFYVGMQPWTAPVALTHVAMIASLMRCHYSPIETCTHLTAYRGMDGNVDIVHASPLASPDTEEQIALGFFDEIGDSVRENLEAIEKNWLENPSRQLIYSVGEA